MPVTLPVVDLSTAIVGTVGTVSFNNAGPTASLKQYTSPAHIQIYNESGAGLILSFKDTGGVNFIPAGGWQTFTLPVSESGFTYTVLYMMIGSNVTQMVCIYYQPGEPVPAIAALGNSPIGGGVVGTVATQLSNTGNAPGSNIINAQPNDVGSPTWTADNSGNLTIRSDNVGVLTTLLQLIAGASPEILIGDTNTPTITLGKFQVNNGSYYGTDSSNTIIQASGTSGTGNTRIQNTDQINLQVPGGTSQITITSSGCSFSHSINLVVGSLGQLSKFTGTGNGTIATGITNPTALAFDPCTVSGSSQTIGGTTSSSSVVTTGSGLAWSGTAWHN